MISVPEAVRVGEIQPEASPGPEVRTVDRILDDDIPPLQSPCLGTLGLVARLADNASDIFDDLANAQRALRGVPLGYLRIGEGRLERVRSADEDQTSAIDNSRALPSTSRARTTGMT